ncbi:unnamed protein product [Brachionus calyciflorus]|uniref:Uncharacterized protein n=1 Tax=Brachionus calyciflorus TaxID=104777 RepID=A0A814DC42_9BILA|nr:unnamed protein product [Brachionus calyciflorus]
MQLKNVCLKFSTFLCLICCAFSQSNFNNEAYLNKSLNEITWLTAHNSHLNVFDNVVLEIASNQNLSLDKQLYYGVRGFMLDIDLLQCSKLRSLFGSCSCEGVCLCHGSCSKSHDNIKDGFLVKKLEYALKKFVKFLNKNPNEIITLFLENYVADTKILQNVFDRVKHFNQLVFNPYSPEWDVLRKGWPKIKEMIASNKRILIFDDEKKADHAGKAPGFIRSRDFLLENHFGWHNDFIDVNLSNFKQIKNLYNSSSIKMEISRCVSLHRTMGQLNWSENKTLDLNFREHENSLLNSEKMFLFHHYYGVSAKSIFIDSLTVKLMNTPEFVNERLKRRCNPGINGKKPNYIALDFINENTYKDLILPFNI